MSEMEPKPKDSLSEKNVKAPNIFERAKEEIEAVFHHDKTPRHHKETHGRSDDIDKKTSTDEVKAPGVFERVKEEIEAVVEAIHPKKESDTRDTPSK
ncbi:uncharacterized protein LOC113851348 [Abrus precatorius]|uniref:Uncharacterized protein LOC113851348 n=1 Tax=Abrus precatorius TaxID=3816 RepID=A0A8B8K1F8_ABRPR|nr:uncharacterized protein LOC113851348 [Abrus precatorius]